MMENGFITIQRKILNWEWYSDTNVFRLFLHLLLKANWENKKWKGIEIKRGQLVTSINHLSKETGLTIQQVRTAMNKLNSTHEITSKATNKYTLVTIENYDFYQIKEDERTNKRASNKTNEQQQLNNITINKKEKEINKEKESKISFAEFVSMTNGEHEKLVATYGADFTNKCIEVLDNYKGANGKNYKSDYRAILNWVVERVKQDMSKQQPKKAVKESKSFDKQFEGFDFNSLYDN